MKTLKDVTVSVKDGIVTMTGKIAEGDFDIHMAQRVTVGYLNPENHTWPRHIQLSHEAVFVRAFGNGFGLSNDDMVKLATAVEPKTSYPPMFKKSVNGKYHVELSSELQPDFQWQVSDKINKEQKWENIPGETFNYLKVPNAVKGRFVRCVASSEAGSMISNPVIVD